MIKYSLVVTCLVCSVTSYASLSATTAKVIEGNEPLLVLDNGTTIITSIDDLLTVTFPDGVTQYPPASAPIPLAKALSTESLSQYSTKLAANNQMNAFSINNFADSDGDQFLSVKGFFQATWKDKNNQIITNLSTKFDACNGPYTLTINAGNASNPINVTSKYGYPNNKNYGYATKSYRIDVKDYKVCYLKPTSMATRATGTTLFGSYAYGGYNSAVFDTSKGFIPSKTAFPTTAFPKASFQLVMSGAQTDYTYQVAINNVIVSDSANASSYTKEVSVDGNGLVTFNSKPTKGTWPATVKFIAKHKTDTSAAPVTYTSKINLWLVSSNYMDPSRVNSNYDSAVTYCKGKGGILPTRSQLTNSPYANPSYFPANTSQLPTGTSPNWWGPQYFQRDSDPAKPLSRSLTSEWGSVSNSVYSGSGMGSGYYSSESYNNANTIYGISLSTGEVSRYAKDGYFSALCVL